MSALRINLLPAYIAETKKTKQALIGFLAFFAVAVGGSLFYYTVRQGETTELEANADDMERQATAATAEVNKIKADAKALRDQIAPIGERVQFVKDVRFYNAWAQKVYRRAATYTDSRVEYSSMAINAGTLAMTGYVSPTPGPRPSSAVDNLARYLITFYGNPDVTAVTVTGPPGWQRPSQASINPLAPPVASSGSQGFGFTVSATLLRALQRPALPASLSTPPTVTEPVPTGGPPVAGAGATATPGAPGTSPAAALGAPPPPPGGGEQEAQ